VRKYLIVALAAMFVLGFAASSFAIHAEIPSETQAVVGTGMTQITIGGEVRVRGDWRQNVGDFDSGVTSSANSSDVKFYDERVRLSVEAKVTPNTTGYIQLETASASTTEGRPDYDFWGSVQSVNQTGTRGSVQIGNNKEGTMSILQAWILHQGSGLLGVPALVKIGHMPITIGTGLFYDHSYQGDDAILLGVDPIKGLHIIAGYVDQYLGGSPVTQTTANVTVAGPGTPASNNNIESYALLVNYDPNKDDHIGLDVTYLNDQNNGLTALSASGLGFNSVSPNFAGQIITPGGQAFSATGDIHFWNIGINGKTMIAGFGLYAEFDKQFGTLNNGGVPYTVKAGGVPDLNFEGLAGKAGANYTIDPVKVGIEWAYGSGGDKSTKNDIDTFITSQGQTQHFSYVYDYRTVNAAGNVQGGLQNTWYLKASANADITKALSAELAYYYLRAVDNACISTGVFMTAGTSKNIGNEVDARVNYKIDRNLTYFVEGGYLFAGGFWRGANSAAQTLADVSTVYANRNPDDAWVVRHGIQLSF
jgi:hypothetical protein